MKLKSTIAMFYESRLIPCGGDFGQGARNRTFVSGMSADADGASAGTMPPVPLVSVCEVNGVDYAVDCNFQIWDFNGCGEWLVIGRVLATADDGMGRSYLC